MTTETLLFFQGHKDVLPLYARLEKALLECVPTMTTSVSKTQISFYNKRCFGTVSFNPVRCAAERPPIWMTVSFGLGYRKESPRIDGAVQPYPNRWTHHMLIAAIEEIDTEMLGWLQEAAEFSARKR